MVGVRLRLRGEVLARFGPSTFVWTYPFDPEKDLGLVERTASLGGDHLEVGGEAAELPRRRFRALGRALSNTGLTSSVCAVYGPERDLAAPDPHVRSAGREYARACIETANAIGARLIVGAFCGAGGRVLVSPSERAERIARGAAELHEVAEMAQDAGVTIAVEGLNRYENNLVNTIADVVDLVDRSEHSNIGVHLDLFHANIEESGLSRAIRNAGSRIVHCHAVDNTRGAPGSGCLPWREALAALRDAGYDGALVIESFDPGNARWAAMTASWRPLASSQDELAGRGLAFLKAAWELA